MMQKISNVLSGEQLNQLSTMLKKATFTDGGATAGSVARRVKNNEQATGNLSAPRQLVIRALLSSSQFQRAAFPHRLTPPLFSRYRPGMAYGRHMDDAVMGKQERMRVDISVTLFLSAPEDYDGGELELDSGVGKQHVKLAAGDALIYPTSAIHQVNEVTRGMRQAAVCWVESKVPDAATREVLSDLSLALEELKLQLPESEALLRVQKTYTNLLRRQLDRF